MRDAPSAFVERHRVAGQRGTHQGAFRVFHAPTGATLRIVASDGRGWEHVSVSLANRTPNWLEMEYVCRLFWTEDEAVMQLHPPRSDWISNHPHCLHLWRPTDVAIPLPPSWMVGTPDLNGVDLNAPDLPARMRANLQALETRLADEDAAKGNVPE